MTIPIVDAQGNPAWPAVFPTEKIKELRETVGERHFSAQMMLNFLAPDKIRLDPGSMILYDQEFNFQTAKIGENLITGATVYWDPSSGKKDADNSVCALIYRDDKNKRFFLHDILYLCVPESIEYPLAYQCRLVLDFIAKHKLHNLVIETNGIGNAIPEIMRDTVSKTGGFVQVRQINNSRRKEDRILDALEPLLTSGRLYAARTITQTPLFAEMLAWTPLGSGEHDDGLDAVAGAICGPYVSVRSMGFYAHKYTANTDFNI